MLTTCPESGERFPKMAMRWVVNFPKMCASGAPFLSEIRQNCCPLLLLPLADEVWINSQTNYRSNLANQAPPVKSN
jgi:hypothetical protein